MNEIGRHIVLLLLTNDCVIVPDFGGFMVHHIDAIYDEAEGLYYPPRQSLGFNPQLKLNDSLLAYSYAEAYDMSFPEALQRLMDDVEKLVTEIKEQGLYEIDDIGVIRLNSEGAYEFEPFESGILTPSLYGLSSFAVDLKKSDNEAHSEAEKTISEQRIDKTDSNLVHIDTPTSTDSNDYIRIPKRWVRYAAVACVALMLLLIIPLPTNTIMQTLRAGQMDSSLLYRMFPKTNTTTPTVELKSEVKKPNTKKKAIAAPAKIAQTTEKKVEEAKPLETVSQKEEPQERFTIVLASKVSKANANDFVKRIAAKGYTEGRVVEMTGGYRVVYGKYQSQQEASDNKHKLDDNELFAGCWIMETAKK